MTFNVIICLGDKGKFTTFFEAYQCFFEEIRKATTGGLALQALESCYIEIVVKDENNETKFPLSLYEANDLARDTGILVKKEDGKHEVIPPSDNVAYIEKLRTGLRAIGAQMAEEITEIPKVIEAITRVKNLLPKTDSAKTDIEDTVKDLKTLVEKSQAHAQKVVDITEQVISQAQ